MSKHTITEAVGVTTDEVLRVGKLYSSNELRSIQKKLTSTSGDLHKLANGWKQGIGLLGSLGDLLSREQRELLRNAARLVDSISQNVTHAKEKRVRAEKDAKRRQDGRRAQAKQLVARTYPLPDENDEQRLDIVRAALILNRARQPHSSCSPSQFNSHLRKLIEVAPRLYGGMTLIEHRACIISSVRTDMIEDLNYHLAYDDGSSVEERLRLLQEKVAEAVGVAVLTADERETLRLWQEALRPAANRQEGQA